MANPQNLIPNDQRTPSERRANASKAGKASGEARRRRKNMQEMCKFVLGMPLKAGAVDEIMAFEEVKGANVTVEQAAVMAVANKAIRGDHAALAFLRDTAGEKPIEKVEVNSGVEKAAADIKEMIAAKKAKDDG